MGSPNILFDVEAHQFYSQYNLSDDRQKRSAFYRCKDVKLSHLTIVSGGFSSPLVCLSCKRL